MSEPGAGDTQAQHLLIFERLGEHGARITATELAQSGIKDDLREIRDLIRQQARPAQSDVNALALHNLADAMRQTQAQAQAPATAMLNSPFLMQTLAAIGLFALGSVIGQPLFSVLKAVSP